jgi:hypothetical protein
MIRKRLAVAVEVAKGLRSPVFGVGLEAELVISSQVSGLGKG